MSTRPAPSLICVGVVGLMVAACSRAQPTSSGGQSPQPAPSAPAAQEPGVAPAPAAAAPAVEPATPPPAPSVAPERAARAPAATQERLKGQLIAVLSGYEHIVMKNELARLGSPAELTAALTALYHDTTQLSYIRAQALSSLRFFPSPASKSTLEGALMSAETSDPIRRVAVKAYGAGFGVQAVPILSQLLDHGELHTRNAAARTLAEMNDDRARAALRRRLPEEKEPLVRKSIETGLQR